MPGLARDSHALKMDGVVDRALEKAGLASAAEVDAVAVTVSESGLSWVVCLPTCVSTLVVCSGRVGWHSSVCLGRVAARGSAAAAAAAVEVGFLCCNSK